MLNWAKKHVRHKHKEPDEQQDSETEHSSDKERSSPEKKNHSEKRTPPSFARRLASFRKLTSDRKSPDKGSRGKSKSPEKGLKVESKTPETSRHPSQNADKNGPSDTESCPVSESNTPERQPSPAALRQSPRRQLAEGRDSNTSPKTSPNLCLNSKTKTVPDLEPSEDKIHTQTTSEPVIKSSNLEKQSDSVIDVSVDGEQNSDTHTTPERFSTPERYSTPDRYETPERDQSPKRDPKADVPTTPGKQTSSSDIRDLVIRESDEVENTGSKDPSDDSNHFNLDKPSNESSMMSVVTENKNNTKNSGVTDAYSENKYLQSINNNNISKELADRVQDDNASEGVTEKQSAKEVLEEDEKEAPHNIVADGRDAVLQSCELQVSESKTDDKQLLSTTSDDGQDGTGQKLNSCDVGSSAMDQDKPPSLAVSNTVLDKKDPYHLKDTEEPLPDDRQLRSKTSDDVQEGTSQKLLANSYSEGSSDVHQDRPPSPGVSNTVLDKKDPNYLKDTEEPPPTPMSESAIDIKEISALEINPPRNSEESSLSENDTPKNKEDLGAQIKDSLQVSEAPPESTPPYNIVELVPDNKESAENNFVKDNEPLKMNNINTDYKQVSLPTNGEEYPPSSQSGPGKDSEEHPAPPFSAPPEDGVIPPPLPSDEPPDDSDVPPPLPESEPPEDEDEPPEDEDEPPPLPVKEVSSVNEKPPLPPKSDLLKYNIKKNTAEQPLPISPFSIFDRESKDVKLKDSEGDGIVAQHHTEGKHLPIVSGDSSGSCEKSDVLHGSAPHLLDASHSEPNGRFQGSSPSFLNTSFDSGGATVLVPPSPARRLSRGDDKVTKSSVSQSSLMNTSYESGVKGAEHKSLLSTPGATSAVAVGGSLPTSPSTPRRTRRPHPVPAARSLQTLSTATPSKMTVPISDKEEGMKRDIGDLPKQPPEPQVEAPKREKHTEKPPIPPVPKPRKIVSLNPFESDEDEETECQQALPPKQIPIPKPRKIVSLNPFDSDDDNESETQKDKDTKAQVRQFPGPTHTATVTVPVIGKNPFDDDENENSFSETSNITREQEFRPIRASSPSVTPMTSSYPYLSPQHLNDSLASINSQSFKGANESTSTNPFGEDDNDDDDDDSIHNGLTREARSRKSFSVMSSSPLQRDGVRSSLPHTARIMTGRKKRQAPLPPSPRPPASSTSSNDRFGHDTSSLSRGGSPLSFNQGAQRKDSTASTSSLTTSPRKTAPPRPPPPKVKNDSPTKK